MIGVIAEVRALHEAHLFYLEFYNIDFYFGLNEGLL